MQIKRFEAPDMPGALRMIKQEFGSEAVILSAKNVQQEKGLFGFLKKPGVEVTAAAIDKGCERVVASTQAPMTDSFERARDSKVYTRGGLLRSVNQEVESFGTRKNFRKNHGLSGEEASRSIFSLYTEMLSKDVHEHVATELVKKVHWSATSEEIEEREGLKQCLSRVIEDTGMVSGPVSVSGRRQKIVALVGPTGVGKTTTIAKLAVQYARTLNKQVALITTDMKRIGAWEQIKAYARIIGIPMEAASDREELQIALARTNDAELVLIDTAGIGRQDQDRFRELTELLNGIRPLEVHLALSATSKNQDVREIFQRYRSLPVHRVIITKVDETNACGHMVRHLMETDIPLSFITNGQNVAHDIVPATPGTIVEWITNDAVSPDMLSLPKSEAGPRKNEAEEPLPEDNKFYIANKNSDVFHYHNCRWAKKIKAKNMIVFDNKSEALRKELKPCRLCIPEEAQRETSLTRVRLSASV